MAAESRLLPPPPLPPLTGAQTQMLASASAHKGSVASHPGGGDPKTMATGWLFDGGAGDLSLSVGLLVAPDCVVDVVDIVDNGFSNFPPRVCAFG